MRPLLVIVLVLAAIGALLFAVFNIGGSAPHPKNDVTPAAVTSDKPGPSVPTPLDPGATKPRTQVASSNDPGRAPAGPGNAWQPDNKLTGVVHNKQSEPVVGAQVILTTLNASEMFFVNDPLPDLSKEPVSRTDAEGRYTFTAVTPRDRYTLIITHPDYARKEEPTMPLLDQGTSEMPPIVLGGGATLQGKVQNEAGDMITGATIHLEDIKYEGLPVVAPDQMVATSGPDGVYKFKNVAPGQRYIVASAPGYATKKVSGLTFTAEEIMQRDVTLPLSEMLCGKVLGPGNVGIAKANVMAVGMSNLQQTAQAQTVSNDKGEYCFENLAHGDYNVIASARGFRMLHGLRATSNTNNNVIEMLKEASVCGRVIELGSGKPVASFTVRLRVWYGTGVPTAPLNEETLPVTNANGEFCIDGVPPGDFVVEAMAPGNAPGLSANFTVQTGTNVTGQTVQLGRGGSMTGRIVDADGKPVAHARITTHDNDWTDDIFTRSVGITMPTNATESETRTGDDGHFSIANLRAETYLIVVQAPGFTELQRKDVRVVEGSDTALGDLKVGRGGSVRGTLYDVSGKPLVGGTINLQAAEGESIPRQYSTRSGGDGKFQIANVAPGRYLLSGMRTSGGDANPFSQLGDEKNSLVRVTVTEGETYLQELHLTE